ncbi:hypothetical protein D9M68_18670 [compost metagenome]
MFSKVSGIWREMTDVYVRVAAVWRRTRYVYVKVAGVWKRVHRAKDALYSGSITMGYVNYAGVDNWGFSRDNYGSASPTTLKDGTFLQLCQVAADSRGSYGPRRWLQLAVPGNVTGVDIPAAEFAGFNSVEIISVTYISAFGLTEILLGFASQLPNTGTHTLKF